MKQLINGIEELTMIAKLVKESCNEKASCLCCPFEERVINLAFEGGSS